MIEEAPVTITEVRTNSLFGTLANAHQPAAPMLAEAMLTEDMGA